MTRKAIIVATGAVAVAALFVADDALAQAAGNFLGANDVYGMGLNFVHAGIRLGQYGIAVAGMWAGWQTYQATHHIWDAASRLGVGAAFFFGVPMAAGIPVF
jgi:hypothetical protein